MTSAFAQAPVISSVTPANGATGVAADSPIVFVFNQAMDDSVALIPSFPPILVGNIEIGPASLNAIPSGTWSTDTRTLTVELNAAVPANTTVTWRLNPPGMSPFATAIQNASGTALATASGSFTTGTGGGTGPQLVSANPANGTTNVPVSADVVFVFDQAMNTNNNIAGSPPTVSGAVSWSGTGVDPAKFSYSWSTDATTLTCSYLGDLPVATQVQWTLNPLAAPVKLESQTGQPVASINGTFTTGGGVPGCNGNGIPTGWGSYGINKNVSYLQTSSADPTPSTNVAAFIFSSSVVAPAAATLSAASVELPDSTQNTMMVFGGTAAYFEEAATETALDTSYPPGNYTLRFTLTGQTQRVIPMTMPANTVPIPKITNFGASQNVTATADFTLQWNGFTSLTGGENISFSISDVAGNTLFTAPDACVPRDLPASAKSIVIPANTLLPGRSYTGMLIFGRTFYSNTNAVPQMAGFGNLIRITEFTITTSSGGVVTIPATLSNVRLLPNGNPEFNLTGTAGRSYNILRSGNVGATSWPSIGTVTMDVTGAAVFEDTQTGKVLPLFYKAVGN